jgi:hypothetical protein
MGQREKDKMDEKRKGLNALIPGFLKTQIGRIH